MSEDITVREAAALLQGWDRILILTHQYPDGDTLGSGFALCRGLQLLGKTAPGGMLGPYPGEIRLSV